MATKPEAVETLPKIEDLLGVTQKAEKYVEVLLSIAQSHQSLKLQQVANGKKDSDAIEGAPEQNGHTLTYGERYKETREGIERLYAEIEKEGIRANVDQLIAQRKS